MQVVSSGASTNPNDPGTCCMFKETSGILKYNVTQYTKLKYYMQV